MDYTKEESIELFGEFKKAEKQFYLQQAPYLDGPCTEEPYYRAWAVDSDGRHCILTWASHCDDDGQMIYDFEDEQACDWTVFKVRY